MFKKIKKYFEKKRVEKETERLEYMAELIKKADDSVLLNLDIDFHDGIAMDSKMGILIRPIDIKISNMIKEEIHKRNLQSQNDIEENAFFSQKGLVNIN